MWLRMYWTDEKLVWDPTEYGGIEALRIPNADVWNPDVVLLNNADGNFEVRTLSMTATDFACVGVCVCVCVYVCVYVRVYVCA